MSGQKKSLVSLNGKIWELSWKRYLSDACLHSVFLLSNGTLLITQVKPRNTGTYKCVGRGIRGSPVTLEASLLIAGVVKKSSYWCTCNSHYLHRWFKVDCRFILYHMFLLLLPPGIRSLIVIHFFHSHRAEVFSLFPLLLFPPTIQFV